MADNFYARYPVTSATGVTSLNGQTGALTLLPGANITITPGAGTLTIASTSSGANTALSNLASVAVNANLDPGVANTINMGTNALPWGTIRGSGYIQFQGLTNRGSIGSGNATPSGATSQIDLTTTGTGSASLAIYSASGAAATNPINVETGNVTSGVFSSGAVLVRSGNSAAGNSGALTLQTGTAGVTRGQITFLDGTEGTAGNVWTSTGTSGQGAWVAPTSPSQQAFTTKTANYTMLITDDIIYVDTTAGPFTLTLPNPTTVGAVGFTKIFRIIDTAGMLSTNNLTLARFGSEKIEGLAASKVFSTDWGYFQVTTNRVDWFVG